ncbi:winged helix-turn-helix domain-containing protein [Inquilinus limosus]|uniref:OmpR/PhoB-type domain-containing protein n=1 Tax=Inquilinus limosus TaxID=171674 RepID=A0A211ZUY2_9PROT|nr:winged helix-turn-helix domain-containing protein [Inquilinus limosus]OWJ69075.1 hypothetical protein BWR60_00585 [Inquilinus limosus]
MAEAGPKIRLSKSDHALPAAFLDAPQRPLSRPHLAEATRLHGKVSDRTIDVRVLRLRRKLERAPCTREVVQIARGLCYVFTLPVERLS